MSPEYELCYEFYVKFDVFGSMMLQIFPPKIVILLYFNDKNVDIEMMYEWLNHQARRIILASLVWKVPFRLIYSTPESWITDFYKKIEFVLEK